MTDDDLYNELIGMTLIEASEHLHSIGLKLRVVRNNGDYLAVTRDYRLDRVNIELSSGFVYKVVGVG